MRKIRCKTEEERKEWTEYVRLQMGNITLGKSRTIPTQELHSDPTVYFINGERTLEIYFR